MKFPCLVFQRLRRHVELQDEKGNFVMEQIVEEYGNAILTLLAGGMATGLFLKILEVVTAF